MVNWAAIMHSIVNSRGHNMVPGFQEGGYQLRSFVFVTVTMIGGFFIMNLFVGVIINSFNNES